MGDGERSITAITGSRQMRGGKPITEVEGVTKLEGRQHCFSVIGREDGEPDARGLGPL